MTLTLDMRGICDYQQNRAPYLLMDAAEEVIPGVSARGYRDFAAEEWFFACHFPGDPNVPGALQLEAMVQLAALTVLTLPGNKGKVVYLSSAEQLKLLRKIVPGDRLQLEARLHSWKRGIGRCSGIGRVGDDVACRADFTIVMPDVLEQFRVRPAATESLA